MVDPADKADEVAAHSDEAEFISRQGEDDFGGLGVPEHMRGYRFAATQSSTPIRASEAVTQ